MRVLLVAVLAIVVWGMPAWSQTTTTGKASTSGPCSPANSGNHNHNTYIIKCGIGAGQGNKIVDLLNKVLANQDLTSVNSKLDELLRVASAPTGVVIQAPFNQTGGDCTQNVVGGNNNTNYCAPKPVRISASQAEIITNTLKAIPGLTGSVDISYELSADGKETADALAKALRDAGISARASGAVIIGQGCDAEKQLPGLSFDCIREGDPLALAIARGLINAHVIAPPIKATGTTSADARMSIIIRKP